MAQPAAAAGAGDSEVDQTAITWTDPNYPFALSNRGVALHYFEQSPFFDPSSNNTTARQQGRDPAILGALEFVVPAGGLEFVVETEQPPHLFVIRKQQRRGQDTSQANAAVTLLALYYILDKVIYQAPTLYAVLSSRIRRCVWALHQGFSRLQNDLDPLIKVNQHQAQQEQQREQQRELQAMSGLGGSAPGSVQHVESAPLVPGLTPHEGLQLEDELEPDVRPIPIRRRISPEEAAHWKRTDNIVLTVLSGYPLPTLPDVYFKQQQEAGPGGLPQPEPAPGAAAPPS